MHFHLEVIMPPTKDIEAALDKILLPFSEHEKDSDRPFWDYYGIGGRWAGTKETCRYDAEKLEQFHKNLKAAKMTVSSIQMGKQKLEPASQIPMVDQMWNELFPTETGEITPCPLFAHANNQFDSNDLLACDICRVDEIAEKLTAHRVIIAAPGYQDELEAQYMLSVDEWNGVNFVQSAWDGKVLTVLEMFKSKIDHYTEEYQAKVTPQPNWICVTVDYHS
jgi:hypothetical protein